MGKRLKDWRFWTCVLLFLVLFGLIAGVFGDKDLRGPISLTYVIYAYVPIALTIASWLVGLYQLWTGRWKREDLRGWGFLVLLCGNTVIPVCIFSNGALLCMGVSLVLGIGAVILGKASG